MACTVLIVDDAALCAETLELALIGLPGVHLMCAGSAEAALQMMAEHSICAFVTDLHLPEMSGFDLIRHVREHPAYALAPIVVVSGDTDPATPDRLRALGVAAFFPKPYSPSAVRQKLENLLNEISCSKAPQMR